MKLLLSLLPLLSLFLAIPSVASPLKLWPGSSSDKPLSPVQWKTAQARPSQKSEPKASSTPPAQVPEGGACASDDVCVPGTYCDNGQCIRVRRPFNILYLFYRSEDSRFTEILGIYWHQRGVEGYKVVFPFYWHFWKGRERTRVVFPFFYRHASPEEGIRDTIVVPFQFRSAPGERNYRLWPLFFWTDYGERGAGLTVLPLFHFAREGSRRAAILPLLLSGFNLDPSKKYSQGLIGGLFYWHTDQEFRSRALFPLFYHRASPARSFTWVLPLNFHWRRHDDSKLMILPLLYRQSSPDRARAISLVPPFYYQRKEKRSHFFALPFFYRQSDGKRTFFLGGPFYHSTWPGGHSWGLFPLIFTSSSRLTAYRILFPIVWQFASRYHNFTLAGPAFYYRRGSKLTTGLFPLGLYHRDRKAGESMAMLLPLFYYDSLSHHRRARFVSPLFLYERDDEAHLTHWGLLAPPYYSRRDADLEVDTLIPLMLRWHNKVERSTTWMFGPLVYHHDPEGGTQVLFPLFWRFNDAKTGAATSILFPLAYRHRRPDGSHFNLLLPFYYRRGARSWSTGILPVLFAGSSPGRRHAVLFPLFWHVKTHWASTTVLGPAFHRSRHTGGWHAGLLPLLFLGSEAGESYQILFPALWHLRSKREGYNTWVAGPAFWTSGRKGRAFGLLPLFAAGTWKNKRFTTVLPPLFYHSQHPVKDESLTVVGPYIGWSKQGERGHAVLPLAYFKRSPATSTSMLLPLFFHRRRTHDQLLVTPLGGFRRERGTFEGLVGPLAWHRGPNARGFAILPLLYHWRRPAEKATTTVLLPIGVRHDSPERKAHVWFPFIWRFWEPTESSLVLFPLYWRVRQNEGLNADVAFPLVWSFRSPKRRLHIVGPFFWSKTRHTLASGLAPLYYYTRSSEESTLYALPFIYYHRDQKTSTRSWVIGPFYRRTYAKGSAMGLFPVLFRKDTPQSRYSIVVPIFWDIGNPETKTRTTFIGPFFHRRKVEHRAVGLAPLLYASWDKAGGRTAALVPLFYYSSEIGRQAFYCPLFGWDRSPDRRQWYAGTFYQRRSATSSFDMLAPLFFRYRNHRKGQTTLFSLPGYYGQWSREKSFHLFFPLFWSSRRIDRTATVMFPFYWDFNNRYSSRTTLLFPLLLYHRDHLARSSSYLMPPGLWLRFRPDASDAVLFPLVWHFGGEKRSSTVGFPLYWDFLRPGKRSTVFFPLFWRFRRGDERKTVVINTYYASNTKRDTYNFMFFLPIPIVHVQRKRPGDLKVELISGLFGYERVGRNRLLTLFFYTFPLKPEAASSSRRSIIGGARRQGWSGSGSYLRSPSQW